MADGHGAALEAAMRVISAGAALLILTGVPGGRAEAVSVCDGFEERLIPAFDKSPFVAHSVAPPYDFIPGVVADYDNDGDPDLPHLENLGGLNFQYRTEIKDLVRTVLSDTVTSPHNFHGVASVDYDEDGWPDLVLGPYYTAGRSEMAPILLLRNQGGWAFELAEREFLEGLLGYSLSSQWYSETIVVADLTGDGANDLYIPFYTHTDPWQSVFLRRTETGLAEEAVARGLAIPGVPIQWRPEGAAVADLDQDGDLDLYVAQYLFLNDGAGNFTDAAAAYGLARVFDEGAAFVDFDNDGRLDLYLRAPQADHLLFRNTGQGFENVSVSSGLACITEGYGYFWGDAWADYDRDGDLDLLFMVNGPQSENFRLILNQGDGQFTLGYAQTDWFVHLAALADFDGDGDLDLDGHGTLAENVLVPADDVVDLRVIPVSENGLANQQGTAVRVTTLCGPDESTQTRVAGGNVVYLAQGEYEARFALRQHCGYRITVDFPRRAGEEAVTWSKVFQPAGPEPLAVEVGRDGRLKGSDVFLNWPVYLPAFGL